MATEQEIKYRMYIEDHIQNVKIAYKVLNDLLFENFNLSKAEMDLRIKLHDQSKFNCIEFNGYRRYFYPEPGQEPDKLSFDIAWKNHYTVNDHHPEHWQSNDVLVQMPEAAVAEMFCDWLAMSYKFKSNPVEWFNKHEKEEPFPFHEKTRELVNEKLFILEKGYLRCTEWGVEE
jgi:hypothetical protein